MDESGISLTVCKEIKFTKDSLIKYLVLENNSTQKLVFKVPITLLRSEPITKHHYQSMWRMISSMPTPKEKYL